METPQQYQIPNIIHGLCTNYPNNGKIPSLATPCFSPHPPIHPSKKMEGGVGVEREHVQTKLKKIMDQGQSLADV